MREDGKGKRMQLCQGRVPLTKNVSPGLTWGRNNGAKLQRKGTASLKKLCRRK